jgi:penicillin-binding protein 1A
VTLLSLTSAFAAFANEGILMEPTLVRRVRTQDGDVVHDADPESHRALSPATAYLITSMLQDVIDSGTASRSRRMGFRLPAAGKTGTTNEYRDAWFVGYTPTLVTGVWVGYDRPRTIVAGGYAAELAVPLWTRFMMAATRNHAAESFRAPGSVVPATMCRLSGRLATDACRHHAGMVYTEYFRRGTEPTEWCLHPSIEPRVLHAAAMAPAAPTRSPPPVISLEPPPAAPVERSVNAAPEPQAPTKKRGFWGRLFGRGDNGDREEKVREEQ